VSLGVPSGCMSDGELIEMLAAMKEAIATSLGVDDWEVELGCGSCEEFRGDGCGVTRRLTAASGVLSYSVHKASEAEAQAVASNLNVEDFKVALSKRLSAYNVEASDVQEAQVVEETLDCSTLGNGKAFPLGILPTSLSECACDVGYEQHADQSVGLVCELCPIGTWKATVSNVACTGCPTQDGVGLLVSLTTLVEGATTQNDCTCPAGIYEKSGVCSPCPIGNFCEGGVHHSQCSRRASRPEP
jgi:hypothetical protein